jgi:site-specific recombinase XerD
MGIYKRLADVPDGRRLNQYAAAYDGRDVWDEFLTMYLFDRFDSERFKEDARRAGRRWESHMDSRGRHHALATPADVDAWCEHLLDTLAIKTAYNQYWVQIERFYSWLQQQRAHPHTYQPVLMAAANGEHASDLWSEKIGRAHGGDTE